jgi:hypothetical protein
VRTAAGRDAEEARSEQGTLRFEAGDAFLEHGDLPRERPAAPDAFPPLVVGADDGGGDEEEGLVPGGTLPRRPGGVAVAWLARKADGTGLGGRWSKVGGPVCHSPKSWLLKDEKEVEEVAPLAVWREARERQERWNGTGDETSRNG